MTNNKQETAVEWLIEKQLDAGIRLPKEWREQAKEMEMEQIIEAFEKGVIAEFTHQVTGAPETSGDEYYNETYGHGV